MGRPFLGLPRGAREHLEAVASHGLLSEIVAAQSLGMPLVSLRHVIATHAPSRRIWEDCLAIERDGLLAALFDRATAGDARAATTLLAIRHGLTDRAPQSPQMKFDLPPGDLATKADAVLDAVAQGRISADAAKVLIDTLGAVGKIVEVTRLEERITMLEGGHVTQRPRLRA